jgi:heterodisulfide reductase subunit A-like polyferredoxin
MKHFYVSSTNKAYQSKPYRNGFKVIRNYKFSQQNQRSTQTSNQKEGPMEKHSIGAVMVVGGGIAGIQVTLDLADSGYYVYLVEKSPGIGGVMAKLDKTFPTNDCAM